MTIDIAEHGPHGLIGGTSGSGKTEFLKTLFVSLCLENHPDDLSIVIVDFKGGVDHEHSRLLPHVIDVATNLDEDRFARTVRLLDAEQRRRQGLLSSVGAANIDAYRAARLTDPSLPPVPRLLVSDGGRQHLKNLQSVTRIGRALGVHLLLVTQTFQGQLPTQVEANAALRISLRVQTPTDSKMVLGSPAAASILDSHKGRAYARFHGRDLIEFQTARVAGRRRDLMAGSTPVSVRPAPFPALASLSPAGGGR
ncbi:MAG: hypothetical protein GY745_02005 [Actinomycetia bacterium]|nr:hypothetical protein [Actinomycetes bacterium]